MSSNIFQYTTSPRLLATPSRHSPHRDPPPRRGFNACSQVPFHRRQGGLPLFEGWPKGFDMSLKASASLFGALSGGPKKDLGLLRRSSRPFGEAIPSKPDTMLSEPPVPGQALDRLVPVSSMPCGTSTPGLSTSSSPRGLTGLPPWEISS